MPGSYIFLIIFFYFGFLIFVSYLTGKNADNQSFFLGNRQSPWYVVSFGMISALLSGVTFISVPGWVLSSNFSYMQMVLGYLVGYMIIAHVLLPLYYRLNLTSIYGYLDQRFGVASYKTGASFFLLSRLIGASFRLFLVANVLQIAFFNKYNVPFEVTVAVTIVLIWLYTARGGIKTIIWTDALQTLSMLTAAGTMVYFISNQMGMDFQETIAQVRNHELSQVFFFENISDSRHFIKMFSSGILISVVMTGLDQDMMQKSLSCRNIRDAQKNVYGFSIGLIPVNLLFLSLGVLLVIYAQYAGMGIPENGDDLFPLIAMEGGLPVIVPVLFIIGLIAAAYSSADSALTSLTTSFTVDILDAQKRHPEKLTWIRKASHLLISFLLAVIIIIFEQVNNKSVIDRLFYIAGYTYGPLLGMYAFGLLTNYKIRDRFAPFIAVLSPVICLIFSMLIEKNTVYEFGYELLLLNGILTFIGFFIIKKEK